MAKLSSIITPIAIILFVLLMMPFILQLGGQAAQQAQTTFNQTIDVGGTQVNLGGVAALIIMLAMIFLPIYIIERYMD